MAETVECVASALYPGDPLAFTWQAKRRQVRRVLARWRTPHGRAFRIQTAEDQPFALFYDEDTCQWRIVPLA